MQDRILFEDDYIIAVHKRAGELVIMDRWKKEAPENILLNQVGNYLRSKGHQLDESGRDLYPVHRLDRDTSGIVLFAKNADSHRAFGALFEGRAVEKFYWTFAIGDPNWDWAEIDLPLLRAEGKAGRGRATIHIKNGKPATTEFLVLGRYTDIVWLECKPKTGRLHQIRVHLRALGHPLLGDIQYGITDWTSEAHPDLPVARMPLHARLLRFQHPFSHVDMEISCPLDNDMRQMLDGLKRSRRDNR